MTDQAEDSDMSYLEAVELIHSETFRERTYVAVLAAAIKIMSEAGDDAYHDYYTKRAELARHMISTGGQGNESFIRGVALNPTISAAGENAPDGDIDFVVESIWDALAGVTYNERPPA